MIAATPPGWNTDSLFGLRLARFVLSLAVVEGTPGGALEEEEEEPKSVVNGKEAVANLPSLELLILATKSSKISFAKNKHMLGGYAAFGEELKVPWSFNPTVRSEWTCPQYGRGPR